MQTIHSKIINKQIKQNPYPWERGKFKPTNENYMAAIVCCHIKRECKSSPKEVLFSVK
jgi:hypothetical protein